MALAFPTAIETSLAVASRDGATVTGGAADTKGSYTELIASTGAASECLWVQVHEVSAFSTDTSVLLDIATGAAASEVVLVPDMLFGYAFTAGSNPHGGRIYQVPVSIASGTRISARLQGAVASETAQVTAWLGQAYQAVDAATAVEAVGENTTDSGGVTVTSGNGAWGSWTSIGTISADRSVFYPGMDADAATTVGGAEDDGTLIQIGYGTSAPDSGGTAIDATWLFGWGTGENVLGPFPATPVYADLSSGETLWARIASGGAAFGVVIHAMECAAAASGGGGRLVGV